MIVECQSAIAPVIEKIDGVTQVVRQGEPLPTADVHAPLMTLALIFKVTVDSIPANVPYIVADPSKVQEMQSKLPAADGRARVGLVWAGNPNTRMTAPGLARPHSWKYWRKRKTCSGSACKKTSPTPISPSFKAIDIGRQLKDFSETAAVISQLDLVITVDTAVAHLAGAMNKPVWIMLPFAPDWRWLTDREDSPWYLSARLFRQKSAGSWSEVITRVVNELQQFSPAAPR